MDDLVVIQVPAAMIIGSFKVITLYDSRTLESTGYISEWSSQKHLVIGTDVFIIYAEDYWHFLRGYNFHFFGAEDAGAYDITTNETHRYKVLKKSKLRATVLALCNL